jgi:hypothetical protein
MKKRGRLGWLLGFGALGVMLLCAAAVGVIYWQVRARALSSRPLVMIHSPLNHDQAQLGEGLVVHATARAKRGVRRMELWADGIFVSARDNPAQGPISPLVLSAAWMPASSGTHALLVRAVSADGVEGQAAVAIDVVGEAATALGGHTVAEGETLASIAEEYGVSPDELDRLNPDIGAGGVEAGDELTVPGGEGAFEEPPSESDGVPGSSEPGDASVPDPEDPAPGDFLHVMWAFVPEGLFPEPGLSEEPVSLRLEALSLQTDAAYERVHCYIGMADALPRWYPDADGDQSTDEWFAPLPDRMWNVAEYLSGEAAPIITWPGNQPLSVDATCVGILGGGTEAVELGHLLLQIPPGEWDGVARWSPEVSNEGSFTLEYRVVRALEGVSAVSPDPSMTPPTNLALAGWWAAGYNLYWAYEPRADEAPIDGFRVYLNGTLLWAEPADARTTPVPSQWLFPCAEPYTFTVTAYRGAYPGGSESTSSDPPAIIEADPLNCQRVVYLTFHNLTTHDLGSDGQHENRSGDVGPAYGHFFGNDQQVSFDGRPGNQGLSHNTGYVIRDLWNISGPAQLRVELGEGDVLDLGFHIDNEDTGICNDASDPGCDDLICEATDMVDVDIDTSPDERILESPDGRCAITYSLTLGPGFPAEAYGGALPLPWLTIDDVTVAEGNQLRIHLRNSGRASWPAREVKAAINQSNGESIDVVTWPAIDLGPGETTILQTGTLDLGALPACVILDPDNEVGEWGDALESEGVLEAHPRFCVKRPDLVITGVEYDPTAGQVLVTVQNQGEGLLENRTVGLRERTLGEGPEAPPVQHPLISLGPRESTVLTIPADESLHSEWFGGYTVTVDPEFLIAESDDGNNTYTVVAGRYLHVALTQITAPWHARNDVEFEMHVSIVSAGARREVADWHITQDIDWTTCAHVSSNGECRKGYGAGSPFDMGSLRVGADEALEITVHVSNDPLTDDAGHTFTYLDAGETYRLADDWGAGDHDAHGECIEVFGGPGRHGWVLGSYTEWSPSTAVYRNWNWAVNFNICD